LVGYRLYRLPPGDDDGAGISTGPALITDSSYLDVGAPSGTGYRLCAVNGLEAELELGRISAIAPFVGMRIWPSPAHRGEVIHLAIATPFAGALVQAGLEVTVFDIRGRRVAAIDTVDPLNGGGALELTWDGRDDAGQPVASGIYFVSARAAAGGIHFRADQRLVVAR
jgi:hypothetical protein